MIGCSKPLEEWPDRVRSLGFVGIVLAYSFLMFSLNEPESKSMFDRCSAHRLLPEQRPLQTQPLTQNRIYSPSQSHSGIYSSQHQASETEPLEEQAGVRGHSDIYIFSCFAKTQDQKRKDAFARMACRDASDPKSKTEPIGSFWTACNNNMWNIVGVLLFLIFLYLLSFTPSLQLQPRWPSI